MTDRTLDLLQGTLDLLILKTLSWGSMHGYAVARWISDTTEDDLKIEEGALYTALHRMEDRGWIAAEWGVSPLGRRAKFYRLTPVGKKQLQSEQQEWTDYVAAVGRVLKTTTEPA